jgi:hypothetical protein
VITESFIQKINTRMTVGQVYGMYINELLEQALKPARAARALTRLSRNQLVLRSAGEACEESSDCLGWAGV